MVSHGGLRSVSNGVLLWQANVRAFGGDPDRVTLIGQSSGASNVNALLASSRGGKVRRAREY